MDCASCGKRADCMTEWRRSIKGLQVSPGFVIPISRWPMFLLIFFKIIDWIAIAHSNCALQRFTNAAQRCIKAVYRPCGYFFASLRQRSCSSQCRYRSANAVTKMHCCSERKTAFVQPFCSTHCSTNKSLKQRCFNVFCIVRDRSQFVNVRGVQSEAHSLPCGVPQGSVLGPVLYLLYTSPLGDIVRRYNMGFHFYADDTQLYLSFNTLNEEDRVCTVAQVESCVRDIDHWMASNRLKLNNDKTELLVISSKYQLSRPLLDGISVGGYRISPTDSAKNIGVVFDQTTSLDEHVKSVCKSALFHLQNIAKIREYLNVKSTKSLVHAFVTCRLDNCNSLLIGLPSFLIQKLQCIQNCAARLVTGQPKFAHVTPILKELHWLPIEQRVAFKVLLLA